MATVTLINSQVNNNRVTEDGGGVVIMSAANALIIDANSEIYLNTAGDSGGGIDTEGEVILRGGKIRDNTAADTGGGICIDETGKLTMESGSITGNTATDGGGIYQRDDAFEPLLLQNGEISGNTASNQGGAVYIDEANAARLVVGATVNFHDNTAPLGYEFHMPKDDAIYNANIGSTQWSAPYTQGFNNLDIGGNGIEGYNIYNDVPITGTKNVLGTTMPPAGSFEFGVYDENDVLIDTTTNDANGFIEFLAQGIDTRYTPYTFKLKEIGGPAGWNLDTTVYTVTLVLVPTASGGEEILTVYPQSAGGTPITASFVNSISAPTCGLIEFPELRFTLAGDYEYTLREITKNGAKWVTDTTEFRVIIHVTEDSVGNLFAQSEYPDGYPEFVNSFFGLFAKYTFTACKIGVGAGLIANRFNFGLYDEDDTLIATAGNAPAIATPTAFEQELKEASRLKKRRCAGTVVGNIAVARNHRHGAAPQLTGEPTERTCGEDVLARRVAQLQQRTEQSSALQSAATPNTITNPLSGTPGNAPFPQAGETYDYLWRERCDQQEAYAQQYEYAMQGKERT